MDLSSPFILTHSKLIARCYEKTTGHSLAKRLGIKDTDNERELALSLYQATSAILSHERNLTKEIGENSYDNIYCNIYNYANQVALNLFERSFEEQTQLPSSSSTAENAKPQCDRNNLLAECLANGSVIFNSTRLSASGKEVLLENALLFNLFDEQGIYRGQAVIFDPK